MPLSRDDAWKHLCDWTDSLALRNHARAVEVVMEQASVVYDEGQNIEKWAIAGMLHDADYDRWPTDHPRRIVVWLEEKKEFEIAHAISAHYTKWGISHDSQLDKALLACDELTGFIVACSLVRPEGVRTLKPKSVKKKLKDKSFAAKVERDEVHAGVELLETDLTRHIQMIIDALKPHAEELGIMGKG